jgi:hypothetical protein
MWRAEKEKSMKCVKTLGLAAMAAMALMAFVGVGSPSAAVLCKTAGTGTPTGTTCPAGWAVSVGSEVHMVSEEKPVTTSTFKTITCDESTLSFTVDNEGSETESVKGPVGTLTAAGNCNCTVAIVKSGSFEIHWISGTHNGTVTDGGLTETVQCSTIFGPVHCAYVTENDDVGTLTGSATTGSTATLDITFGVKREATTKEGALCDEEAIWHVKYKVTTPDVLNVTGHT